MGLQMRCRLAHEPEHRDQVHVQHPQEIGVVVTFKRVKGADAGTGYDGVEPSHRLHSLRDKA